MSKDVGGNTAEYYEADNYYSEGGSAPSEWIGKGAERAGLSGVIQADDFNNAREGKLPDGSKAAGDKRTPGWDMTVSAPKSLSIMALVAGDKRLIDVHREAAKKAITFVETQAATRVRYGKQIKTERTGNLIVGRYTHDTSRAGDPQLHDHLYIMNRTWHAATKTWRAVESRSIYSAKEAAGRLYKAVLREGIEKLGYQTTSVDKNGNFEIKGVDKSLIETFSKRSETISEMAKDAHNPTDRETRERIALMTRERKDISKSASERTAGWREESGREVAALGALRRSAQLAAKTTAPIMGAVKRVFPTLGSKVKDVLNPQSLDRTVTTRSIAFARDALQQTIDHISQNTAVPSESDLLATTLQFAANTPAKADDVLAAISDSFKNGAFVQAETFGPGSFTTRTAVEAETEIQSRITSADVSWTKTQDLNLRQAAELTSLSQDQKNAFVTALGGSQRYASIVGYAGTGKSFLVKTVKNTIEDQTDGGKLLVLAPKHEQVADFKNELGAEADTVAHFLASNRHHLRSSSKDAEDPIDMSDTVLFVDEAGMLSNTAMRELVQLTDKFNIGRVVFMGDPRQKQSPEQGVPFQMGLKSGVSKVEMRDIRRQKTASFLLAAQQAARGHTAQALNTLEKHVHSVEGSTTMEDAAFAHWRGLAPEQRQSALIVATTLERRDRLNNLIREAKIHDAGLGAGERLGSDAHQHTALMSKRLSSLEARTGRNVEAGDTLVFHRNIRKIGIERGDQLSVSSLSKDGKSVTLTKNDGETVQYAFPGAQAARPHFEAFKQRELELREKERLAWTKSDKKDDIRAGTEIQVLNISDKHITLRNDRGEEQTYERSDPRLQHVNYAYSSTSFSAQGQTRDVVIGVTGANDRYSGDQAHTYVLLSRVGAKTADQEHLAIFTDDAAKLMDRYNRDIVNADSALLALGKDPDSHKSTNNPFHNNATGYKDTKQFIRASGENDDRTLNSGEAEKSAILSNSDVAKEQERQVDRGR